MYCTSKEFLKRMQVYINEIEEKSNGVLFFVEYIPLPHFGNTVLRFDIDKTDYTLEDLDAYEAFMQAIVKDEFLVDFMGSVYQKAGFEPWMYEDRLKKCFHKYRDVQITAGDCQALLKKDADFILNQCGLAADAKIWEIQNEEEPAVFLLGSKNRKIGKYPFKSTVIHVYEVEETSCMGLMKAITLAKQQHVSMLRILLEA